MAGIENEFMESFSYEYSDLDKIPECSEFGSKSNNLMENKEFERIANLVEAEPLNSPSGSPDRDKLDAILFKDDIDLSNSPPGSLGRNKLDAVLFKDDIDFNGDLNLASLGLYHIPIKSMVESKQKRGYEGNVTSLQKKRYIPSGYERFSNGSIPFLTVVNRYDISNHVIKVKYGEKHKDFWDKAVKMWGQYGSSFNQAQLLSRFRPTGIPENELLMIFNNMQTTLHNYQKLQGSSEMFAFKNQDCLYWYEY
jgi:hypothetical protein